RIVGMLCGGKTERRPLLSSLGTRGAGGKTAMAVSSDQILDALRVVQDPDLHRDIVSLGFVQNIQIDDERIKFDVVLTTPACPVKTSLQEQARSAVMALPGVRNVDVNMTFDVASAKKSVSTDQLIPLVKNVIAVASGKGGVGKS